MTHACKTTRQLNQCRTENDPSKLRRIFYSKPLKTAINH
ncbi:hypothetical protein SynMITS9220_00750 [Synechococcus sp. MIT S9220]|nr:hypothetical protein SynMITS9220_00750 [Synechococcus sp. MIT S9220]